MECTAVQTHAQVGISSTAEGDGDRDEDSTKAPENLCKALSYRKGARDQATGGCHSFPGVQGEQVGVRGTRSEESRERGATSRRGRATAAGSMS